MKDQKWFTPMQIAQIGLIQTPRTKTVNGIYAHVLKAISSGKLPAKDYSLGSKPYFKVHIDDINKYNESL